MLLDLDCRKAAAFLCPLIEKPQRHVDPRQLEKFAADNGLQLSASRPPTGLVAAIAASLSAERTFG